MSTALLDKANALLVQERDEQKKAVFALEKILVPIDFSDCSVKALKYATPLARQSGADLTLIYVVKTIFTTADVPEMESHLCEYGERELRELARREIGVQPGMSFLVGSGAPAHEIVRAAKELDVDLIVISTHGRTGLPHLIMGSTAEAVVRYAPCPVLVVRQREHEFLMEKAA